MPEAEYMPISTVADVESSKLLSCHPAGKIEGTHSLIEGDRLVDREPNHKINLSSD
jgi:hypothetical protein